MKRRVGIALLLAACGDSSTSDEPMTASTSQATTQAQTTTGGEQTGESTGADDDTTGASEGPSTSSTATTASESSTGMELCPPPADPTWLEDYLAEIVADLSQTERSTPGNRAGAATYIVDRFDALGLTWFEHEYDTGVNPYAQLVATTGASQTLVVGAHYDTVPGSPGANDNATGVAMVLAMARYLKDLPCREYNVLFVAFDEEELGLVGSRAFAAFLVQQEIDVESVHTIDQMGWDSDSDRAVELERPDTGLFELYDDANGMLAAPVPLQPTGTGSTDHVAFREFGFAAVGLTEEFVSGDTTPHYHLPSDTFATVDIGFTASTTALAIETFAAKLTP